MIGTPALINPKMIGTPALRNPPKMFGTPALRNPPKMFGRPGGKKYEIKKEHMIRSLPRLKHYPNLVGRFDRKELCAVAFYASIYNIFPA